MKIYRAMPQSEWENVCKRQYYGEELMRERGYIPCVTAETALEAMQRQFPNLEEPLVLLCIETDRVIHQVKWEDVSHTGVDYPHIYGLLNLNAVERVLPVRASNGDFILPENLTDETV